MKKYYLFVWDIPADPRMVHALSSRYADFEVIPMTYAAAVTCQKYLSDNTRLLDQLLSPSERKELQSVVNNVVGQFYQQINDGAPDWCCAISANMLPHYFYYIHLAHKVVVLLKAGGDKNSIILYRPLGLSHMPELSRVAFECFKVVVEANSFANHFVRYERVSILSSRVLAYGYTWLYHKIKSLRKYSRYASGDEVDLLFVALEESDRRIQAPLIEKFSFRAGLSFRWLAVDGNSIGQSVDELAIEAKTINPHFIRRVSRRIDSDKLDSRILAVIRHKVLHWVIYRSWISACGQSLTRTIYWRISEIIALKEKRLKKRHEFVEKLLSEFQPKVIVINSFLQSMRSIQLEALRKKIPIIALPHGVTDVLGPDVQWNESAVGRFGSIEKKLLEERFPSRCGKYHSVGGGHLAYMAMPLGEVVNGWPVGNLRVLFPTTIPKPFFPSTPTEIMADARELVLAGAALGAITTLRCHPRQKHHNYFDYELMLSEIDPRGWQLSDGSDSLVQSLTSSHIVVVSHYSGAVVQALYAPRPIVCWMPRSYTPFSDQILQRFPCRATTQEELVAVYRRIQAEPDYRAELLQKQKELLAELVEDPYGDPYAGSEKLVMDMLRKVKDDETGLGGACGSSR